MYPQQAFISGPQHLRPYSLSEAQRPDGNGIAHTLDFFPANKMDIQNGSTAQEIGDQQPNELPILGEKRQITGKF
jgi:hypothetical protein